MVVGERLSRVIKRRNAFTKEAGFTRGFAGFLQGLLASVADRAVVERGEKVVALVVHEDEGGEIFDRDFPDGFHAKLRKGDDFLGADVVLGKECGGTASGAEVEAAVGFAGVADLFGAISFGEHDHGAAVRLEKIDVSIHAPCGGRAEGAGGHARRGFGGACVVNGVVFEVVRQFPGIVEDFLKFRMGDVASDDDGAGESEGGGDWVFGESGESGLHAEIEIDGDALEFPIAVGFRDETAGIFFEFFEEDAVFRDFCLRLAVGGA